MPLEAGAKGFPRSEHLGPANKNADAASGPSA